MRSTSSIRAPLVASAITTVVLVAIAACSKTAPSSDSTSLPNPTAPAATSRSAAAQHGPQHDLQWGPAPAVFPPGAEFVVMQGDPSKPEEFTVRLRLPSGYKIPPHTHPTVENITVLTGTFLAGAGTTFVESQMQALGRDEFLSIPAEHAHYAMARGQTIVQVHGIGPFALTYVNPADNPAAVAR
jgi:quercetin dioxygenase-like cupin family protein